MFISLFELMEDDGEYTCKYYKSRLEILNGPYITIWFHNDENLITVQYHGETIYSREIEGAYYDDGFDTHMFPTSLVVEDLKKIKEEVNKFWVDRRRK